LISKDRLIGWLCIARHQFSNGSACAMPRVVSDALIERGWMARDDGCDTWNAHLTSAGLAVTDLNAPDWGINSLPQETEA
jgi:hypothetical protein